MQRVETFGLNVKSIFYSSFTNYFQRQIEALNNMIDRKS